MTTNDGVPTTDAQFDAMLGAGFDEAMASDDQTETTPPDTEADELVPTGDEAEESEPEPFDTGSEDEPTEDDSPELVADVLALVDSDDKATLKSRITDMGKGIEKLKARDEKSSGHLQFINQTFDEATKGNPEAIKVINDAFVHRGSNLTDFAIAHLSREMGIEPEDFKEYFPTANVTAKPTDNQPSPKETALEERVARMEAKEQSQQWASKYGEPMASYVEKVTGMKFDVATLSEARSLFPAKASAQDIVKAVMKTNPDAYLKARDAEASPDKTPNSALVSKGGKSATKLDASTIINDPTAFERLISS